MPVGHLEVHQDDVRSMLDAQPDRRVAAVGLGDHLDVVGGVEDGP